MTWPTGALSTVTYFMALAYDSERHCERLIENEWWSLAIEQKFEAEKFKALAAVEFLLWVGAVSNMADEPKPWDELQAKLAKGQQEKSNGQ